MIWFPNYSYTVLYNGLHQDEIEDVKAAIAEL